MTMMNSRMKPSRVIVIVIISVMALVSIFPVLFTFANSFMSPDEVYHRYTSNITEVNEDGFTVDRVHFVDIGIPRSFTFEQYGSLLFDNPAYLRMFWNSVILLLPILVGQFILAPLAAYGFENMRFRYKEAIYFMYIIVMLMPTQILLVPNFIVAGWFSIRETYWAIILPALFHPLGVFLIRQQLKNFPRECMEAAALDGATPFQIYVKIVRPNLSSVVAAVIVLVFADNWNIIDQAVIFIKNAYDMPLSVQLGRLAAEAPEFFFAASFFYVIPAILVFLLGQKSLTRGLALGYIKH